MMIAVFYTQGRTTDISLYLECHFLTIGIRKKHPNATKIESLQNTTKTHVERIIFIFQFLTSDSQVLESISYMKN